MVRSHTGVCSRQKRRPCMHEHSKVRGTSASERQSYVPENRGCRVVLRRLRSSTTCSARRRKISRGTRRGSCKIFDEDWKVSSEIMEWFIRKHQPKAIVIASTTVMKWTCVRCDLAAHPEIDTCVTDHPRNTNPFSDDVREFLDKLDKSHESPIRCGARADSPFRLNEAQRRRCRSYPWRKKPAS